MVDMKEDTKLNPDGMMSSMFHSKNITVNPGHTPL